MSLSATLKTTGEIIEFAVDTPEHVMESYARLNEYEKVLKSLKSKLQDVAADIVGPNGTYEHDGKLLRVTSVQRTTYDMTVLRDVIQDEDTINGFMELSKARVDKYIKDNLDDLGAYSTELRSTMVPVGRPYRVVRFERVA